MMMSASGENKCQNQATKHLFLVNTFIVLADMKKKMSINYSSMLSKSYLI